jgi:hypothetical protein
MPTWHLLTPSMELPWTGDAPRIGFDIGRHCRRRESFFDRFNLVQLDCSHRTLRRPPPGAQPRKLRFRGIQYLAAQAELALRI